MSIPIYAVGVKRPGQHYFVIEHETDDLQGVCGICTTHYGLPWPDETDVFLEAGWYRCADGTQLRLFQADAVPEAGEKELTDAQCRESNLTAWVDEEIGILSGNVPDRED